MSTRQDPSKRCPTSQKMLSKAACAAHGSFARSCSAARAALQRLRCLRELSNAKGSESAGPLHARALPTLETGGRVGGGLRTSQG